MESLDLHIKLWNERKDWIDKLIDDEVGHIDHDVSEQACALFMELQSVFCAGAWATVIILSMTIIDAQLREIKIPEFQGSTEKLLKETGLTAVVDWLRRRRNKYIHYSNPFSPARIRPPFGNILLPHSGPGFSPAAAIQRGTFATLWLGGVYHAGLPYGAFRLLRAAKKFRIRKQSVCRKHKVFSAKLKSRYLG